MRSLVAAKLSEAPSYTICSFDPSKDDLRIFWRDDQGTPYRTFSALAEDVKNKGKSLRFAMNGGMYQEDCGRWGFMSRTGNF